MTTAAAPTPARALVTAVFGCADAAIQEWVCAAGDADIRGLYADALAAVHAPA